MLYVVCSNRCFPSIYCGKRRFSPITVYVIIHMLLAVMSTPVFCYTPMKTDNCAKKP